MNRQSDRTEEDGLVGKRVVIAEDEAITMMQLQLLLKQAGLQVVGRAKNGKEAVDIILRERPDVVLMDIRMPLMDGLEAADRILSVYHPCLLFVTGFDEYREQALASKACGYVLKPILPAALLDEIRHACPGSS